MDKILRTSVIARGVGRRGPRKLYSTQVIPRHQEANAQTTKVKNGVMVGTVQCGNLHASVSLVVSAGSRFEDPSANLGVSHRLRTLPCTTGEENTAFESIQLISSLGASLEVSGTREHIAYNLRCGRKIWRDVMTEGLLPTLQNSQFHWWELGDLNKTMQSQVGQASANTTFRLVEAMHRASFHGGLANSVLSPAAMIGSHTSEMVRDFFDSRFNLGNVVVVGSGVNHRELCEVVESSLTLSPGTKSQPGKSRFISTEVREHEAGRPTCVGIGFAGVSLNDQDTMALAVLQHILGGNTSVKYESGIVKRLPKVASKNVDGPVTASAFSANYSDSGLLGIVLGSDGANIGKLVSSVNKEIASMAAGGISEAEINAGKQSLKGDMLMLSENSNVLVDDMAVQLSVLDTYVSPEEVAAKVDSVSPSEVLAVAKKVFGSKKSLVAFGDVTHCPYLSDL